MFGLDWPGRGSHELLDSVMFGVLSLIMCEAHALFLG